MGMNDKDGSGGEKAARRGNGVPEYPTLYNMDDDRLGPDYASVLTEERKRKDDDGLEYPTLYNMDDDRLGPDYASALTEGRRRKDDGGAKADRAEGPRKETGQGAKPASGVRKKNAAAAGNEKLAVGCLAFILVIVGLIAVFGIQNFANGMIIFMAIGFVIMWFEAVAAGRVFAAIALPWVIFSFLTLLDCSK